MKKLLLTTVLFLSICGIASAQQKKSATKPTKTASASNGGDVLLTERKSNLAKSQSNKAKLTRADNSARKIEMMKAAETSTTPTKRAAKN